MVSESRLVVSNVVEERSQEIADQLMASTSKRLRSIPLFETDRLGSYANSLKKQYGKLQHFAPTVKRERPLNPRLISCELLNYAQVIKIRTEGMFKKVVTKVILGNEIDNKKISISYIER